MSDMKDVQRERRRTIRHKVKVRIEMLIRYVIADTLSESTMGVKGRLLDLSTDGCMLFTKKRFDEGQALRLTILIPWQPEVVTQAVVHWCKALPEKEGFASGVSFKNLPEKGLKVITKFLAKLESKISSRMR